MTREEAIAVLNMVEAHGSLVIEAKDMAIKALEQEPSSSENPNRWIPCSERLPKESEYVGNVRKYYLIQDEYGDMHVAHYNKIGWTPVHSLKALGDEVVAWMPLPEPYKAESEVEDDLSRGI